MILELGCSRGSPRDESRELSSESASVLELALPDDADPEAERAHRLVLSRVSHLVRGDLLAPPLTIRLRQTREGAGIVSVPEAPVNEHTPPLRLVGDVRSTGEVGRTNSISHAELMKEHPDGPFGSSVALPHGLHADRRLGRGGATAN